MKWGIIRFLKSFSLRSGVHSSGFFFNSYTQTFHPCVFCYIEDLNDSIENHALVGSDNDRPHFVKGNKRFQVCFQISEVFGLVLEEDFISIIDSDNNGLSLVYRRFDISLRQLHNDSGFPYRIEGIDQAERCEEEDKIIGQLKLPYGLKQSAGSRNRTRDTRIFSPLLYRLS